MASRSRTLLVLALAAAVAGCTVKKTEQPDLSGPSELGLSLSLAANPDTITQDGASQAQVVVRARDANAQPVRSLSVRLDIAVSGNLQDFGRLSAKNVVTGSDGTATVVYTAPAAVDTIDRQVVVSILATPLGNDATAQSARSIAIRLVPPGIITPPPGSGPDFAFTPLAPVEDQTVNFVAEENVNVISYSWSFGDGGSATGRIVDHVYRASGNYLVTLTTVDASGAQSAKSKPVQVNVAEAPNPEFTFSPREPVVNATVFFNATATVPAGGRTIVSYKWDFGDGTTGSGSSVTHKFKKAQTYIVNLNVTDDAGAKGNVNHEVAVSVATP
jgi:PKD repeat protein